MSWCGGGEIRVIPGVEYRSFAMRAFTFPPGNWPPSPGLAPWAILICSTSAFTKYSGVTPNRPEATCLILDILLVPYLSLASPPSPELERAPILFIASAKVSWASGDKAPRLIPAESNFLSIDETGITFACFNFFGYFNAIKSLNIAGVRRFTKSAYSL